MSTSRTRCKLEEAGFFLKQLEEPVTRFPEFNYFLSAFVSAARSVTWIMKAEFKNASDFNIWYEGRVPTAEELKLLSALNDIRVRSEKYDPVQSVPTLIADIAPENATPEVRAALQQWASTSQRVLISKLESGHMIEIRLPAIDDSVPATFHGLERRLPDFPDEDVSAACRRYLTLIEGLVIEWEARNAP